MRAVTRHAAVAATALVAGAALTATAVAAPAVAAPTAASAARPAAAPAPLPPIPLGRAGLAERTVPRTISPGVDITTVFRGTTPAAAKDIPTTDRGPWAVRLVVIDPARTKASLRTTVGADIARTDRVTDLARASRSIVSLNGSFFALGRSAAAPGDPIGFAMLGGTTISKHTGTYAEANVLIDAARNTLRFGKYTWEASARNPATGTTAAINDVNTAIAKAGSIVRFTPTFAARTPQGAGYEVVLDRRGCVTRVQTTRGAALTASQTSLQGTGAAADRLRALAPAGACLTITEKIRDEAGRLTSTNRNTYAVAGRFRLLTDGKINDGLTGRSISGRNPRSVIGTLPNGKIGLLNIDGRSTRSVGATLTETARVAQALGFRDAVNLDGGGSTVLVAGTTLLNTYSGSSMRAVADAIVLAPR